MREKVLGVAMRRAKKVFEAFLAKAPGNGLEEIGRTVRSRSASIPTADALENRLKRPQ